MSQHRKASRRDPERGSYLLSILAIGATLPCVVARQQFTFETNWQAQFHSLSSPVNVASRGPPSGEDEDRIPIRIDNRCEDTIWPGIVTQAGTGPGTGGFELVSGNKTELWVSPDWQGRIWGRTNCTVDGDMASCDTGECGKLDCEGSGVPPATLAEFTLAGGENNMQTFYDVSLVDGYNIPIAVNHIPSKNTSFIPPNLTNLACIATAGWLYESNATSAIYGNTSYPVPWETNESNDSVSSWCPWPYLKFPPAKPGHGVFPYPDDNIERPAFSPCNSACAASGKDKDCCAGKYNDPEVCKPSRYSKTAKDVCPDAYSFAYDDHQSTFIIPKGGGWEVVMCPKGRSTTILRQLGDVMFGLADSGELSDEVLARLRNTSYITMERGAGSGLTVELTWLVLTVLLMVSLST